MLTQQRIIRGTGTSQSINRQNIRGRIKYLNKIRLRRNVRCIRFLRIRIKGTRNIAIHVSDRVLAQIGAVRLGQTANVYQKIYTISTLNKGYTTNNGILRSRITTNGVRSTSKVLSHNSIRLLRHCIRNTCPTKPQYLTHVKRKNKILTVRHVIRLGRQ